MQPSQVKQNDGYDYTKVVSLVPYGRLRYNPFFWTAFCTVLEQFHMNPVLGTPEARPSVLAPTAHLDITTVRMSSEDRIG